MLDLRIARGPLQPRENEAILSSYNELTSSRIPLQEFLRWTQDSPAGPACHALVQTEAGEVVGHTCLIPLVATRGGRAVRPAKVEYSFLREQFRAEKIRGLESSTQPRFALITNLLFERCLADGWGPFLISTTPALHPLARSLGCETVDFPVMECLLVLRPSNAARQLHVTHWWQKCLLGAVAVFQRAAWSALPWFSRRSNEIQSVALSKCSFSATGPALSFFEDPASLRWRYLDGQYEQLAFARPREGCVTVKNGSTDRFLRVCQWQFPPGQSVFSLVVRLAKLARAQNALGVRWAVYGDAPDSVELVRQMRRLGFLCVRRMRTLLIHSKDETIRSPKDWNLTDGMFSFDP